MKTPQTAMAPHFELPNQDNVNIRLADFAGKKRVVFFYPRAMTPGCTKQNCELSAMAQEFADAGVVLIGISPDAPEKLAKFKQKYELNHLLLSDADHAVAALFGAWGMKKNYGREYEGLIRSAFVIDEAGAIVGEYRNHKATGFAERLRRDLLGK